jgi:hypothetical protein
MAGLVGDQSEQMEGIGMVRLFGENLLVEFRGLLQSPRLMVRNRL